MMKNNRIFMIAQDDRSYKYGVGKYVKQILKQTENEDVIEVVFILLATPDKKVQKKTIDNNTYFYIPRPTFFYDGGSNNSLSISYSNAVYTILNDFFTFQKTDIFHFNDNMQHTLLHSIKKNTEAKIIYTIHVSLWKIFYKNDKKLLTQDLQSNTEKSPSLYKRSITSEIQNCKLADKVICLSDDMFDDVVDIYEIPRAKVQKIYNGIQIPKLTSIKEEKENLRRDLGLKLDDFILLYVGRLEPKKGVHFLIEAFRLIIEKGQENIHLIIVGDGTQKIGLQNYCTDFKDRVSFAGYVEPNKMDCYYIIANAIAFPSLNEQSSYVMLEAMSYKLPLIVTNIPAFNVLENNHSCLKVNVSKGHIIEVEKLADKMNLLITYKALRKEIAENAHSLFLKKFTAKKMFNKTYADFF